MPVPCNRRRYTIATTPEPSPIPFPTTSATRPVRATGVREYPLGDEVLLFVDGRHAVQALNASAWAVWDLCDGSRTVSEIADELAPLVGREAADLVPEILETVERLGGLGLLLAR